MSVEFKHAIFLFAVALVVTVGRAFCKRYPALRDACALLLVFGTTRTDLMHINFLSREWYRGTTRGIELSWLDLLWLMLLISLPQIERQKKWLPSLGPMLVFFAYNALVVAFSDPSIFGILELSKMLRQLCLFVTIARYVRSDRELSVIAWALVGAVGYEFLSALRGRFVWHLSRVGGTIGHPNSLSMYELMSIPVLVTVAVSNASRALRWSCAVGALCGVATLLFTVSRNGVFTLALVGVFLLLACGSLRRMTARHAFIGMTIATIIGFLGVMTSSSFEERFAAESLDNEYSGKVYQGRGAYLIQAEGIVAQEPFGCGLNNWSWCVSNRYGTIVEQYYVPYVSTDAPTPRRKLRRHPHIDDQQAAPAHSLYAITLGETGWPGVALLGIVWTSWFVAAGNFLFARSTAIRSRFGLGVLGALIGAFGQSFSEWEIRQTPLAFLLHILLGAAAAVRVEKSSFLKTA